MKLDEQLAEMDKKVHILANMSHCGKRLQSIPGIGLIAAIVILYTVGDGKQFKRGRNIANTEPLFFIAIFLKKESVILTI